MACALILVQAIQTLPNCLHACEMRPINMLWINMLANVRRYLKRDGKYQETVVRQKLFEWKVAQSRVIPFIEQYYDDDIE